MTETTQVGRQDEGLVIVHPDGRHELGSFDTVKLPCDTEDWMKTYRPGCRLVRMRLVPIEEVNGYTTVTPPPRDIERSIEIQFFKDGKWKSNGKAYGEMEWIADLDLHMNLEPEYLWRVADVVKYSTPFVPRPNTCTRKTSL